MPKGLIGGEWGGVNLCSLHPTRECGERRRLPSGVRADARPQTSFFSISVMKDTFGDNNFDIILNK